MGYYDQENYEKMVGLTVIGVELFGDDDVRVHLDDGQTAVFGLEGDCCSHSYYTDPAQFLELVGTKLQKVEERSSRDGSDNAEKYPEDGGETSWHFLVFETNKGHVTIDWRNDSNGYYDGYIRFSIS